MRFKMYRRTVIAGIQPLLAQQFNLTDAGSFRATPSTRLRKNLTLAASPRKSRPILGVMSVPVTVAAG
jgi:hypothetical protein